MSQSGPPPTAPPQPDRGALAAKSAQSGAGSRVFLYLQNTKNTGDNHSAAKKTRTRESTEGNRITTDIQRRSGSIH